MITKIKDSKKIVYIHKFNDLDKVMYKWKLDGSKMVYSQTLNTNISFESSNKDLILKACNNVRGIFLAFDDKQSLPLDSEVAIYVDDLYQEANLVDLYYFNPDKNDLSLEHKSLKVKDGFVWFDLNHTSDYLWWSFDNQHSRCCYCIK